MTHHDKARELVDRLRDDYTSYKSTEATMEAADLITALAEENRRLTFALAEVEALELQHGAVIARLIEENRRLREVLEPFADVAEHDIGTDEADCDTFRPMLGFNRAPYLTVGDLRRAHAALSSGEVSHD